MRKFRHKNTGRIACESEVEYSFVTPEDNKIGVNHYIPKELIEGSNDWIEIKEEDWMVLVIGEYAQSTLNPLNGDKLRELINQHLPKITDDMIEKIVKGINDYNIDNNLSLKGLIKQNLPKDLLSNPE